MSRFTEYLLMIFLLLNVCDILTTEAALLMGASEANWIAAWMLAWVGFWGLWVLKLLVIGLCLLWLAYVYAVQKNERITNLSLVFQCIIFAAVVIWNLTVIFRGLW